MDNQLYILIKKQKNIDNIINTDNSTNIGIFTYSKCMKELLLLQNIDPTIEYFIDGPYNINSIYHKPCMVYDIPETNVPILKKTLRRVSPIGIIDKNDINDINDHKNISYNCDNKNNINSKNISSIYEIDPMYLLDHPFF